MSQISKFLKELNNNGLEVIINTVGLGSKAVFTFSGVGMDERYFTKYFQEEKSGCRFFHFFVKVHSDHHKNQFSLDWKLLIELIIEEYQIDIFDVVAYSIGARLSYPLFNFPQLRKVILVCPDGVVPHPLYYLATETYIGGLFFFPIFSIIRWLSPSMAKFIKLSPGELFNVWKLYSVFKFPNIFSVDMIVYLANSDLICPTKFVYKMLVDNAYCNVSIVEANHFSILPLVKNNVLKAIN